MAGPKGLSLGGEADRDDVSLGKGLTGRGGPGEVREEMRAAARSTDLPEKGAPGSTAGLRGEADALVGIDFQEGTAGPGRTADLEGGVHGATAIGLDDDDDLVGATAVGTVTGFADVPGEEQAAGVGSVPDRGTTAGIGTVREGITGGQPQGMRGSSALDHRTTTPVDEQPDEA